MQMKSNQMTVRSLLRNHQKWTKGTWARTNQGETCNADDSGACRFCLDGALRHCYGYTEQYDKARSKLENYLHNLAKSKHIDISSEEGTRYHDIISFNDDDRTSFKDVRRLLEKVKV